MPTVQEQIDALSAKQDQTLDTINNVVVPGITATNGSLEGVQTDVTDLKNQISNLPGVTPEALQPLLDKADQINAALGAASTQLTDVAAKAKGIDDQTQQG